MKQDLGPLGMIDMLTDKELRESLGHHFSAEIREWYRGVDYLGFAGVGNSNTVTVAGPDSGYCWSLKLVSAQLAVAGELSVYPGDSVAVAPFGNTASAVNGTANEAVLTFTSNVVVLKDQRNLTLSCAAGNILGWRLLVKQVPNEMQGKL
jgi:hypothetical protein